jgi:predicted phosphodiesterase
MKISLLSDLHLEFWDYQYEDKGEDVVVLAGDIGIGTQGIAWALRNIPKDKWVIYIIGNHEPYRFNYSNTILDIRAVAESSTNIHFLHNDSIRINEVAFYGGPMWTRFTSTNGLPTEDIQRLAKERIADFSVIQGFSTKKALDEFDTFEKGLADFIRINEGKKRVVVSHFLPSELSVNPRFKGSLLNAYFMSSMEEYFGLVDMWLHGHTHDPIVYVAEGTVVACNPKGYPREGRENYTSLLLDI